MTNTERTIRREYHEAIDKGFDGITVEWTNLDSLPAETILTIDALNRYCSLCIDETDNVESLEINIVELMHLEEMINLVSDYAQDNRARFIREDYEELDDRIDNNYHVNYSCTQNLDCIAAAIETVQGRMEVKA